MRLGSSIRRRRFGGEGGSPSERRKSGTGLPRIPWRVVVVVSVIGGLGLASGYILSTRVLFPAPPPPGDLREVPNLTGTEPAEAGTLIREVGLTLGGVDSLRHPTVTEGIVLGQNPLPGQLALAGDSVHLTVSRGPEVRPVPDVLRLRAERAVMVLEATGFTVAVDSAKGDAPAGSVVGIEPPPETEIALPAEVLVTVSLGPPRVKMPLLVGLTEEEALEVLESLGLVVSEVETRFRFGMDQGRVVEQLPAAESMVEQGSPVRLVVGRRGRDSRKLLDPSRKSSRAEVDETMES